jgi:hypothetical protein
LWRRRAPPHPSYSAGALANGGSGRAAGENQLRRGIDELDFCHEPALRTGWLT